MIVESPVGRALDGLLAAAGLVILARTLPPILDGLYLACPSRRLRTLLMNDSYIPGGPRWERCCRRALAEVGRGSVAAVLEAPERAA